MNELRIEQMRKAMEKERYDAIVCRLPENVLFLSGYWPLCGWVYLVFPLEGEPVCIVPDTEEKEALSELWAARCTSYQFGVHYAGNQEEEIRKALKEIKEGKSWKRIGYEGNFESIAPAWNAAELYIPAAGTLSILNDVFGEENLIDATEFINKERACKTPYEIEKIKVANEISNMGLRVFAEKVQIGVAAETAVAYRPMEITTRRRLGPSQIALLELAVVVDGYWCDRTRARIAGKPTDAQNKVYQVVKQAQEKAISRIAPGVKASEADEAARCLIREAGYEKEFVHITGHGLGFRYHEPLPTIAPGNDLLFEAGMVHTVEPGIYFPALGGLRIEDNILVTENGSKVLGPFTKELC